MSTRRSSVSSTTRSLCRPIVVPPMLAFPRVRPCIQCSWRVYRVPNLRDSIFFRRVSSHVPCSIRGLLVFVLLLFGQHPISTTPSLSCLSSFRALAFSSTLSCRLYYSTPSGLFRGSLSRRFYLLISLAAGYLSCDVPTLALAPRIVTSWCPRRLRPRLRLRRLIISLLLYRYLHCRYPGGLFGFHVAILAPRSSPLGGTYCHKPRVTALAHLLKAVL